MAPKNKDFTQGKYGLAATGYQIVHAYNFANFFMESVNPDLNQQIINQTGINMGNLKIEQDVSYPTTLNGTHFKEEFKAEQIAEINRGKAAEFRIAIRNEFDKPENKKFKDAYYGYQKLTDNMLDTEKGDFGVALAENPYLAMLIGQFINGPKENQMYSIDTMQERLGGNGPLKPLNEYFSITSDLLDLEYERQAITKDYTSDKEKAYLEKLNQSFEKILENHKKFDELVNEDGTSPYDSMLNQRLDTMVGKGTDTISQRNCMGAIEQIRGQQKAIENGWGMNELAVVGSVFSQVYEIEKNLRAATFYASDENLKEHEKLQREKVEKYRVAVDKVRITAAEKEKAYKETLAANPSDEKAIAKAKEAWETAKQRLKDGEAALKKEEDNLANEPEYAKRAKNRKQELSAALEKFKRLKEELSNTKVKSEYEKSILSEKCRILFAEYKNNPEIDGALFKAASNVLDKAIDDKVKYEPQKIDPEVEEGVFKEEDYEAYNPLFAVRSNLMPTMPLAAGLSKHYANEFNNIERYMDEKARDKRQELEIDGVLNLNGELRSPGLVEGTKMNIRPSTDKEIPNEAEVINNGIKLEQYYSNEIAMQATGAEKNFTRYVNAINKLNDPENGNYLQAVCENPYLNRFVSSLSGGAPDIFIDPEHISSKEKEGVDSNGVNDWTLTVGVRNALMDFYEAGADIIQVEYDKQNVKKNGWDKAKEQRHLAKLDEAYAKTIRAFEELESIPEDIQRDSNRFMGNHLSMITGHAPGEARDCYAGVNGLRWQRAAIRNGWSGRDLSVMDAMGNVEGMIGKQRIQLKMQIKDGKKELQTKLDELNRWEEENLKPLKEVLINKKIENPADALSCISLIEEFCDAHENDKVVDDYKLFGVLKKTRKYILPKTYNTVLEEKNAGKPYSGMERPSVEVKISNTKNSMKSALELFKNPELPKRAWANAAGAYLGERFKNGLSMGAHPELFDPKTADYAITNKKLADYMEEYADRLITVMNPKTPEEFVNLLEGGDHSVMFADIHSKINADVKQHRLDCFVKGKLDTADAKDPSLSEGFTELENSKAFGLSGSTLYEDIKKDIGKVIKQHDAFAKELLEANQTRMTKKQVGVDKKGKPLYEFEVAKETKVDPKEYKAYLEKQIDIYNRMCHYIDKKDKLIAEKGGKPGDASVLGENGEKRYHAMVNARKALFNNFRASYSLNNNGPSQIDRRWLDHKGFRLDKNAFANEAEYNDFVKAEKADFEQNMKYAILRENKHLSKMIDDCITKDEAQRKEIGQKLNNVQNPKEKELLEAKIVESAEHSLYLITIKDIAAASKEKILKNGTTPEAMKNVKIEDLTKVSKTLRSFENSTLKVDEGGVQFNGQSKQFNTFKKDVLNKSAFKDTFRNMVLEGAKNGNLSKKDVVDIRSKIVKEFQAKQKNMKAPAPEKDVQKVREGPKMGGPTK